MESYAADYFIAMATAAVPWIMVAFLLYVLIACRFVRELGCLEENLLLSRFCGPTSAGILFTMLLPGYGASGSIRRPRCWRSSTISIRSY